MPWVNRTTEDVMSVSVEAAEPRDGTLELADVPDAAVRRCAAAQFGRNGGDSVLGGRKSLSPTDDGLAGATLAAASAVGCERHVKESGRVSGGGR
jgi:hypothetical protein